MSTRTLGSTDANEYLFGQPDIISVDPHNGPSEGGNTVTIIGSGFKNPYLSLTQVEFDPSGPETGLEKLTAAGTVESDTTITVTAPDAQTVEDGDPSLITTVQADFSSHADGGTPVTSDSSDIDSDSDSYLFGDPVITGITPPVGKLAGGDTITVNGYGFAEPGLELTGVSFQPSGGGATLEGAEFEVDSDTELTVETPDATEAAGDAGLLDTTVTATFDDGGGGTVDTSVQGDNAYEFGGPVIDAISPASGSLTGGDQIVITGAGFQTPGFELQNLEFVPLFGGSPVKADPADVQVVSDAQIDVTTPDASEEADGNSTLDTEVIVNFLDEQASDVVSAQPSADDVNDYDFGAPVVTSVSPVNGQLQGGQLLTITGSGFGDPDDDNPTLNLIGVNFIAGNTIVPVQANLVSDSQITVATPDMSSYTDGGSTLSARVQVQFEDNDGKTVYAQPEAKGDDVFLFGTPTISSVTPVAGPLSGGNEVVIKGSGFENPDLTLVNVGFDPTDDPIAPDLLGEDAKVVSDSEITLTAPDAESAAGTSASLETTIDVLFDDNADPSDAVIAQPEAPNDNAYEFGAPVIDSVSPATGAIGGGDTVTITGSGFESPGLNLQSVTFDPTTDTDGSTAMPGDDAQVDSDTSITVTTPDATADLSGSASTLATYVNVVFDANGDSSDTVQAQAANLTDETFTYGAPEIDSISPAGGPVSGGNAITITGKGFDAFEGTTWSVSFNSGGHAVSDVQGTIVSDTEMTVTAPDMNSVIGAASTLDTTVQAQTSGEDGDVITTAPASQGADDYQFGTPVVDSVSPVSGPLMGGQTVTITGSGFESPSLSFEGVTFDPGGVGEDLAAADVEVDSDSKITVTTPDATEAADGKSTLATTVEVDFKDIESGDDVPATAEVGADDYSFGAPVVDSIEPEGGPLAGGTDITITGSGFQDPNLSLAGVSFDPADDPSADLQGTTATVVSDTEITVTTPDATEAADGKSDLDTTVDVSFDDSADPGTPVQAIASSSGTDSYHFGDPVIDSVSPVAGSLSGGTEVTITGSGFQNGGVELKGVDFDLPDESSVSLTGTDATVVSDTEITVTTPSAAAAAAGDSTLATTVDATFDNPDGTDVTATPSGEGVAGFTFGGPVIDSVSPAAGSLSGGDTLTITGSGFDNPNFPLDLDGVSFKPTAGEDDSALQGTAATVVSDTEITVTTPSAMATAAADGVSSLNATVEVDFTDPTDHDAQVQASAADAGVDNYVFGAPVIDSVSPASGPLAGGNTVTITGSGFLDPSLTFANVTFDLGGSGSSPLEGSDAVVDSDTQITVTAPDATDSAAGKSSLDATVVLNYTDANNPDSTQPVTDVPEVAGDDDYTFTSPQVTSVDPTDGPLKGGNVVKVMGSGFEATGLTLDKVVFDPTTDPDDQSTAVEGTDATVVSDTEIDVTAPDMTSAAGGAGTLDSNVIADFTVEGGGTASTLPKDTGDDAYTFGGPVVTSIEPDNGPMTGGTAVKIIGSGFHDASLTFDKVVFDPSSGNGSQSDALDAASATVVSDTEIDVTTPNASSAANDEATLATDVIADFTDGADATVASAPEQSGDDVFTFGSPVVTSIKPVAGPLAGGNTVEIIGSGFSDPSLTLDQVEFDPAGDTGQSDALTASHATVVSDTEITVTAPNATAAADADQASSLETDVTVDFTDADDATVASTPQATGDNSYLFGSPVVTSISPDNGPLAGGNTVKIIGSGFSDSALTLENVVFDPTSDGDTQENAITATSATVVSDTEIDVTVPDATEAADEAAVLETDVIVNFDVTDGGTTTSVSQQPGDNTYTFGAPRISTIAPANGPLGGGNTIDITGSGFDSPGLTLDKVVFDPTSDGQDQTDAIDGTDAQVLSDTELQVTVPDATEAAGDASLLETDVIADFDVEGGGSVSSVPQSSGDSLYVFGSPEVTGVDPADGPLTGGGTIDLTGSGFEDPALSLSKVVFDPASDDGSQADAVEAADATVVSDTEIQVVVPDITSTEQGASSFEADVIADFTGGSGRVASDAAEPGDDLYTFTAPPGAPTGVSATNAVSSAEVEWTAPQSDGGTDITGYTVTASPGGLTVDEPEDADSATVANLTPGVQYTFSVVARNADGPGDAATSNPVLVTSMAEQGQQSGNSGSSSGQVTTSAVKGADGSTLTASATGAGAIDTGTYAGAPVPALANAAAYYDVQIEPGATFTTVTLTLCGPTASSPIEWWDPANQSWQAVSDGSAASGGCVTVTIDASSSPPVQVLGGTVFATTMAPQTVSFTNGSGGAAATDTVTLPDTTYVASATGSGGGTVTYSLGSGSSGCSVNATSGAVSFSTPGTCVIDAAAAANGIYSASTADAALTITVKAAPQTVSFTNGSGGAAATDTVTLPDTTYVASATGSGGGTVTYSLGSGSSGCSVNATLGCGQLQHPRHLRHRRRGGGQRHLLRVDGGRRADHHGQGGTSDRLVHQRLRRGGGHRHGDPARHHLRGQRHRERGRYGHLLARLGLERLLGERDLGCGQLQHPRHLRHRRRGGGQRHLLRVDGGRRADHHGQGGLERSAAHHKCGPGQRHRRQHLHLHRQRLRHPDPHHLGQWPARRAHCDQEWRWHCHHQRHPEEGWHLLARHHGIQQVGQGHPDPGAHHRPGPRHHQRRQVDRHGWQYLHLHGDRQRLPGARLRHHRAAPGVGLGRQWQRYRHHLGRTGGRDRWGPRGHHQRHQFDHERHTVLRSHRRAGARHHQRRQRRRYRRWSIHVHDRHDRLPDTGHFGHRPAPWSQADQERQRHRDHQRHTDQRGPVRRGGHGV